MENTAKAKTNEQEPEVHSFMERLFSGDLRVIHGVNTRNLSRADVGPKQIFLRETLDRLLNRSAECLADRMCELQALESIIRYCPELQDVAAGIRMMLEGEAILDQFCSAVHAA